MFTSNLDGTILCFFSKLQKQNPNFTTKLWQFLQAKQVEFHMNKKRSTLWAYYDIVPPPQDGHCSHKLKKGNYNRLAHSEVTFRQKENKAFPSHSHHFSFNIIANLGIQHCNPALKRTQSKQSNRNLKSELHLWIQICAHSLLEPPSFPWGKSSHNL